MTIHRKRWRLLSAFLLLVHGCALAMFISSRPALGTAGWAFLEDQRPKVRWTDNGMEASINLVADGLNFALFRRPIGGWESASVRLFTLINLPAYLAALAVFDSLQSTPPGSSKLHSDLATAVFCFVAFVQWEGIAILLSLRRRPRSHGVVV